MKKFSKQRPSASMIVACLALFVALTGTSYAAVTINGKNIKKKSIAGTALKNNTITGTQVKESKLGRVPLATRADLANNADNAANAANAAKVGGVTAAALARPAAYGHFRMISGVATLDGPRTSSSVVSVTRTSLGNFCVVLNFTPVAATVTHDRYQGGDRIAHVDIQDTIPGCSLVISTINPENGTTGDPVDGNAYFAAW